MHDHAPYYLDFYKDNTLPLIYCEVEKEDITGYVFELEINFTNGSCITKTGIIDEFNVGALNSGIAHFEWVAGDLSVLGTHKAKITITDANGGVETFSNLAIRINDA